MGLLDMIFGDQDKDRQPQAAPVDPNAINPIYGVPEALIQEMKKEQQKAEMSSAWANVIGGAANIARGVQGGQPIYDGAGGGSDPNAAMDNLAKRVMMFSQLRQNYEAQAQRQQLSKMIPDLAKRLSVSPEFLSSLGPDRIQELVLKSMSPSEIELLFDTDKRPIGAFDKKAQRMLTTDELAQRNIVPAQGLSQTKAWEMEDNLRKEYAGAGETKRYVEADPIFRSMVKSASNDTGAADLDLVYGIGKIMDPGSVVREGEMVMVNRASPFAEMLQGYIGSIQGQGKLTPEARARLLDMARTRMGELRMAHDEIAGGVSARAKERGIDPSRVMTRRYDPLPDAPIYSQQAGTFIPDEFINRLRSVDLRENPEAISEFNRRFGDRMAQRVLGIR